MNHKKTIAIDFDGVIHKYSNGWQDGEIYDEQMERAEYALKNLKSKGYKIVVFTTRGGDKAQRINMVNWFRDEGLSNYIDEITDKKPPAVAYIDDRGIRFTNWDDIVKYFA